ncbi:MAG: VWA domain-containing protein [Deltaproteobacteria bacterium]|nr:VWA domain-containing protein [Deltaproteobacteria bacterium]
MRAKKLSILLVVAIGCGGSAAYSGGGSDLTQAAESSGGETRAAGMGSGDGAAGPRGYGRTVGAEAGGYAESEEAVPRQPAVTVSGADGAAAVTTTTTSTVTVETVTEISVAPEPVPFQQQRALLTAASVGDHDRRDNYLDFLSRQSHFGRELGIDPSRRVRFRVVDGRGVPVNDAQVDISIGQGVVAGRTHADGIFDFHPGVLVPGLHGPASARITAGQATRTIAFQVPAHGDGGEVLLRLEGTHTAMPAALDLAFAIDVTGSMEDELRYVNAEVTDIVTRIRQASPETRVRVAATFYRDRTDREVVQQIAFTEDVRAFAGAMAGVRASGGGDYPEDMNAGLSASLGRLHWSTGNAARVLVLIADAPPKLYHDAGYDWRNAMAEASARGIRILPVAASGADRKVEYLFRAMGSVTGAPYVYLTDDSGVGNAHQEADTDRVAVEYFADLLTRLVVSDLRGEGMHEPGVFGPYRQ